MLAVIIPIRLITNNAKVNEAFNKLPQDVQTLLIDHSDNLQKQAIIPLLESSEADFPKKFTESAVHILNYLTQIGNYIMEKQKTYPNILNDLIEFYKVSIDEIKTVVINLPDNVAIGIVNVLEILLNYVMIVSDPKMAEEMAKPEYATSLEYYLYLLLSISALISIFKYENKCYQQKVNTLLQYCNSYAKELEDYTETIEIETNPEDMKRVEKIKNM